MEIIKENIPIVNEIIDLVLSPSLLNKSNEIIYNPRKKNSLLINTFFLEYSTITVDEDPIYSNIASLIINNIKNKNDSTLLILTDSYKESNIYLNSLQKLLNKNIYKEYNIKTISSIYAYTNEKNKKYKIGDLSEIPNIKNNIFIKIKIEYNKDIMSSCLKVLIMKNDYERICPLFCLNHKDYELFFMKEKINNLLSEEKLIENKINDLPLLNIDLIEEINTYKNETFDYFTEFIKNIEKMNSIKSLTKNDLNNFIKEVNLFYDKINKDNYKNKQNNIYKEYIKTYKNLNVIDIPNKKEENNLKSLFIKFNNLNEEILNFLENNNIHKKETANLKNTIKFLQQELKKEKIKNFSKNRNNFPINNNYTIDSNLSLNSNFNTLEKNSNSNKRSFNYFDGLNKSNSLKRYNRINQRNINMNKAKSFHNRSYNRIKHNENNEKYLNKKIRELNVIISDLKTTNENLEKSNQKLKKDIKNLNIIISKMNKNKEENNLENEVLSKSSLIKIINPKKKHRHEYSDQKWNGNKDMLFLNDNINNINNGNIISVFSKNINLIGSSAIDEEHYAILKKIRDENKKYKIKNNNFNITKLRPPESILINSNKENNTTTNNSTSKKTKNRGKINDKLHVNYYANKKSSAGKIKTLKNNYLK